MDNIIVRYLDRYTDPGVRADATNALERIVRGQWFRVTLELKRDMALDTVADVLVKYTDRQRRVNLHKSLTTCNGFRMSYLGNRRCPHCDGYHDAKEAINKALLNT